MKKHLKLFIEGIVQGVGFRPHVYNLARSMALSGYVLNDSRGVTIEAEADEEILENFCKSLIDTPPRLSDIQKVTKSITDEIADYNEFIITKSQKTGEKTVLISPDVALCEDCLRELKDPKDPRYLYPFINCTNCGPRFSIITDVPYDRHNTSMAGFPLCDYCRGEYEEPSNRRFHAQPVACPECGPKVSLLDSDGNTVNDESNEAIRKAAELLKEGRVIAVKGLGGYHLSADADNEEAVKTLRKRKYREDKPFALMAASIGKIKEYCFVNEAEEKALSSFRAPIVLLRKKPDNKAAASVSPGNSHIGFMLAYTPLHVLLLEEFGGVLVMTSGNISEEPICYRDDRALKRLSKIADYFLTNNRPIHTRCDDSVLRIFRDNEYFMRRSRGYAPFPIIMKKESPAPTLATGAELKNTFCLYRGNQAFVSHHIGDLENLSTLASFEEGIRHFKNLFDITPEAVAFDEHPRYLSTQFADKLEGLKKIPVQHHHAHIASVMADNGYDEEVIGVAFDGVGYGRDGKLWGCEVMRADFNKFERLIHLEYAGLPGGEKAIREPWRMALSYLYNVYGEEAAKLPLSFREEAGERKIDYIMKMLQKEISCPPISSAGRLFDAVSSLIGIRHFCNFEGQAAIEMEMLADRNEMGYYGFEFDDSKNPVIIKPRPLFEEILRDMSTEIPVSRIAAKFHNSMARLVLKGVEMISARTGIKTAALSGGVFQNMLLLERSMELLEERGYKVLIHRRVPTNDGGISLGQAAIASATL